MATYEFFPTSSGTWLNFGSFAIPRLTSIDLNPFMAMFFNR